ncbi:MAG: hypothetical protein H5U40_11735, partial [Polyangiaceae bacterium]|nr:hypothetical protein [Polyangiaceae bacterium]
MVCAGCAFEIPSGVWECVDTPDCPPGFVCSSGGLCDQATTTTTCPPLSHPENGSVDRTVAAPGEVATYSCDEAGNYALVGEATRLCLPSLAWEGVAPSCTNLCGNGVVDPGETCDVDCPTRCELPNLCQKSALDGSPGACNVACGAPEDITVCIGGDGCCPAGCTSGNDYDCSFSAVVVGADFSDANVKAIADALSATGLFTAVEWVRVPTTEGADYAPIAASIAGRRAVFAYTASVAAPDTVNLMGDLL